MLHVPPRVDPFEEALSAAGEGAPPGVGGLTPGGEEVPPGRGGAITASIDVPVPIAEAVA